jgi:glutamate 5-kinase
MRRVVKIGSSTTFKADGSINSERLSRIGMGIRALWDHGDELVVVTSGAAAAGRARVSSGAPRSVVAAVGQLDLMAAYREALDPLLTAPLLIDQHHFNTPSAAMALATIIHQLWRQGILPVLNENDALSSGADRIGDNDTLAALLAGMVQANQLVLLSDVDGLYSANPALNPDATRIAVVPCVMGEHYTQFGSGEPGPLGSGGILSKIRAAHMAQNFGIETLLCSGSSATVFDDLQEGRSEGFTRFAAQKEA